MEGLLDQAGAFVVLGEVADFELLKQGAELDLTASTLRQSSSAISLFLAGVVNAAAWARGGRGRQDAALAVGEVDRGADG